MWGNLCSLAWPDRSISCVAFSSSDPAAAETPMPTTTKTATTTATQWPTTTTTSCFTGKSTGRYLNAHKL